MTALSPLFRRIIEDQAERERLTLSPHACPSNRGLRRHPEREAVPDHENFRPMFYHDTDSIIHSRAYTRYIDKTQVFSLFENDHITHRVLHVQFVSKIARVIGRALCLNEDLIEAIALGHDLGHAPFGHDGEAILHQLCRQHDLGCFCHNAQSVRALMLLEHAGMGLNISLQVLDGILAHNGEMLNREYIPQYGKTWEEFEQEYHACFAEEGFSRKIRPMTLEGCVMRISDVIGYIGRDIEDAIELKLLCRQDIPESITQVLGTRNAEIIDCLVRDLIEHSYEKDHLAFSNDVFQALHDLLEFNRKHIYFNEKIKGELPKIRHIFSMLFDRYLDDFRNNNRQSALFTYFLRDNMAAYLEQTKPERAIIDFLAGMTDRFMVDQFRRAFLPHTLGYQAPGE
ncbi:MAG: HD domain-containing protein [Kiritimatiellae bacterium]|nr:HD domain-containing protein [Kiritimatiellia bacterium]